MILQVGSLFRCTFENVVLWNILRLFQVFSLLKLMFHIIDCDLISAQENDSAEIAIL